MDKADYHLTDWHRILFGNAPAEFLIETVVRTIVVYIFLLAVVAMLGKRMSGHVTVTELGIAIMLGAIVAPPMETPERGILQGLVILLLVLWMHRTTAWWSVRSIHAEKVIQGSLDICIKDGIIQVAEIRKIRVSRAELFAILRMNHIYNLGKVERLYMEASGVFTIYETEDAKPGLSLLPPGDDNIHSIQCRPDENLKACKSCGKIAESPSPGETCNHCGNADWDTAVL